MAWLLMSDDNEWDQLFWSKYRGNTNLFDQLLLAGRKFGMHKKVAEDFRDSITYERLILGSYVLGDKLGELCEGEDRIGVVLPTSVGYLLTLFALCYRAKTPALLNFSSGARNVLDCAGLIEIKSVISSRLFVEMAGLQFLIDALQDTYRIIYLEDIQQTITWFDKISGFIKLTLRAKAVAAEHYRVILFTSGSEGKPKGVVLRHANIIANVDQISCVIDYSPADRMLNVLPLFHSFGLTGGVVFPVLEGMEVYLYPNPLHYKIIPDIIERKMTTIMLGTPTFLMGYAKNAGKDTFKDLRYVLAGGERLKEEVRAYWRENFEINIMEAYGATEASPGLCVSSYQFNKTGSVGRFLPGIEWRIEPVEGIDDGGNLLVKGPNIMEGYILHGRGFVPVGEWHNCGDVVWVDDEGYCTIKARLKRFAKISGEMISLNQVEEAAGKCSQSDQHAAVSVPDIKRGEKIVLFTLDRRVSRQQLRDYLNAQRLSMLLLPAELLVLDEFPLLGNGKVDYVKLQEMAELRDQVAE